MRVDEKENMEDRKQRIDDSACAVACVTQQYTTKASGDGLLGDQDDLKRELDYASLRKAPEKMIAVVMEPSCRFPWEWYGDAADELGAQMLPRPA